MAEHQSPSQPCTERPQQLQMEADSGSVRRFSVKSDEPRRRVVDSKGETKRDSRGCTNHTEKLEKRGRRRPYKEISNHHKEAIRETPQEEGRNEA